MKYLETVNLIIELVKQDGMPCEEVVNLLDECIHELKNDVDLVIEELEKFREDFCEDNEICKECGGRLVIYTAKDFETIEYQGSKTNQDIYIKKCEYCGNECR